MNLRCFYCQTPFTVGRAELIAALQRMDAEGLHHYDAHCPRCRRANSISRERMELFVPNWRQLAAEQASMPSTPEPAVPAPTSSPASVVEKPALAAVPAPASAFAPVKTEPAMSAAPKMAKPAAKKPARKRSVAAKKMVTPPALKKAKPASKPKAKPASKYKAKPASKKPVGKSRKK